MASIKKNFVYSTILTTANYIFPLITFPYLTRILGADLIGLCGFVDSIISYFVLFSMMGMNILGIREIARAKNDTSRLSSVFSSLFTLNFITTAIMMIVLVVVTMVVPKLHDNYDLMIIGGVKLMFNFLLIEWLYKGIEDFKYITVRSIIVKLFYVIAIVCLVKKKEDYDIYFLLTSLMIVVNAIINLNYSRRIVKFSLKNLEIGPYIKPFFLLGIYSLLTSMYTTFNVSYLGFVTTDYEVGYYTTASRLYAMAFSIYTAFSGVMIPRMSSMLSDGDMDQFKAMAEKSYSFLLFIAVPLVILTVFNAPGIVLLIAGKGFEGAVLPMRILMFSMIIVGFELVLIEQILMPLKRDKAVLFNSIMGAVVGISLNLLLVPLMGSVGSAVVKFSCELAVFIMAQYEVRKYISFGLPWKKCWQYFYAYFPLMIIEYFITKLPYDAIIILLLSSLVCAIYFISVTKFIIKDFDMFSIFSRILSRKKSF